MQTLSESMQKSLVFLSDSEMLKGCEATTKFCEIFNNIFHILHCRNRFLKFGFKRPFDAKSYASFKEYAIMVEGYISEICLHGTLVLKPNRKSDLDCSNIFANFQIITGFFGIFFAAVRARGGFNNNPNAFQFQSAYKRLLISLHLKVWAESPLKNMQAAGQEEKRLAIANGQVDKHGIPWLG
ncbi:hypothetical protein ILUMI_09373 [Ignelater luminosus]|uniref:Uncharacterized protein n=1 Tax=Ignelater luminosus TaxID=2038154 RepID=A0A8K0G9Q5_IGNLU|nr:hypothetical protein ILUMI_09373 [Ignelater luminosus]